jgi:uncharacterized protein (DUF433 family)
MGEGVGWYNPAVMTEWDFGLTAPLRRDESGTIRVGNTRVTLDSVVHQFKEGAVAEQILYDFPSLTLRQIYGAIFYYLEHTEAVEQYLREQERIGEETRRFIESRMNTEQLRARIRARWAERQKA